MRLYTLLVGLAVGSMPAVATAQLSQIEGLVREPITIPFAPRGSVEAELEELAR